VRERVRGTCAAEYVTREGQGKKGDAKEEEEEEEGRGCWGHLIEEEEVHKEVAKKVCLLNNGLLEEGLRRDVGGRWDNRVAKGSKRKYADWLKGGQGVAGRGSSARSGVISG
jgi:hypothetical protein